MARKLGLLPLFILLLSLLAVGVVAQQTYITKGVSLDNSYQQSGQGSWPTTSVQYQRTGTFSGDTSPLVQDLNKDGLNEIILIDGTSLKVFNWSASVGFREIGSYSLGTQSAGGQAYYQTPGLIDYDADNLIDIVVYNTTHMNVLEWNSTFTLNLSVATGVNNTAVSIRGARYPVVKCAAASLWHNKGDTCAMVYLNRTAGSSLGIFFFDLDNASLVGTGQILSLVNNDDTPNNLHVADLDNDGGLDATYRYFDSGNWDIDVVTAEPQTAFTTSSSTLFSHNLASGAQFTDIIVNNLDGNTGDGLEVTHGFTSDGTNWDFYTVDSAGAILDASYCTALTCPEGELASFNLWEASDTTYSDFSGDVCYYLRNKANNDPGANIDTVHCASLFAGSGTEETEVANTEDLLVRFYAHETKLKGSMGVLTSKFFVQGATKQANPDLAGTDRFVVPVDYQRQGLLDVIGLNDTVLRYYDDAVANNNVNIVSFSSSSGNPVCNNTIVRFTVAVNDTENDQHRCQINVTYANGTNIQGLPVSGPFAAPHTHTFSYTFNEVNAFDVVTNCWDQFHTTNTSYTYSLYTSTAQGCFGWNQGGVTKTIRANVTVNADAEFTNSLDQTLDNFGMSSQRGRHFVWAFMMSGTLAAMIFSGVAIPPIVYALVMIVELVLGWTLGMVSNVILVIVGLVCAVILSLIFTVGRGGGLNE